MTQTPATNKQDPSNSILDANFRQTYLGNQYIFSLISSVGTSEIPVLLLRNPALVGAAFPTGKALFQNIKKLTSLTALNSATFRFYFNPTVSSVGTTQAPVNLRPALSNTPVALLTSAPSVSSNGTFIGSLTSNAFSPDVSTVMEILDPGQSLLVTVQASAISTSVETILAWYEQ